MFSLTLNDCSTLKFLSKYDCFLVHLKLFYKDKITSDFPIFFLLVCFLFGKFELQLNNLATMMDNIDGNWRQRPEIFRPYFQKNLNS